MTEENFGKALRADRASMGFTQEEFCSALSKFTGSVVQQQALARWEQGAIPHYSSRLNLFEFLKHAFSLRDVDSEVLKLGFPESTKNKRNVDELLKIINDQSSEIAKLKDVIWTLIK
jgi:transcriptional regulator with XRE-family HTH domain